MGGGGQVGGGGGSAGWSQGECERRIESFVKNLKDFFFFLGGGRSGRGGRVGGVRLDVNDELKFLWEGRVGGVRVDVNREVKFL